MNYDPIYRLIIEFAEPLLMSTAIATARALGMVVVTPAFNRLGMTGLLRSAVAVVLSLPVVPAIFQILSSTEAPGTLMIAGMMVKELVIGLLIGLVFGVPFWAAEVAGELIDLQRGSTMAQLADPVGTTEVGITSTLFSITLIALFFTTGGFTLLLDGLYRSYETWPALEWLPPLAPGDGTAVLMLLDRVMQIGLRMIAPLVIAILVADLMLAYLARMSPNLHVFDLSLAVKNFVFALLMVFYVSYLVPRMASDLSLLHSAFDNLQRLLTIPP